MEQLNYQTLKQQGYSGYYLEQAPERVLQFGEGNFLRAFVEDFIDQMNEKAGFNGKVVLCHRQWPSRPYQPTAGTVQSLSAGDGAGPTGGTAAAYLLCESLHQSLSRLPVVAGLCRKSRTAVYRIQHHRGRHCL